MPDPTTPQPAVSAPRPAEVELGDDALDSVAGGCHAGDYPIIDPPPFDPVGLPTDPLGGGCGGIGGIDGISCG